MTEDLKIQIFKMSEEIKRLQNILIKNNINFDSNEDLQIEYEEYYARTIKSRQSSLRRVCIKCRQNLTLGKFSIIERKKGPHKSICCLCIKKKYNIK